MKGLFPADTPPPPALLLFPTSVPLGGFVNKDFCLFYEKRRRLASRLGERGSQFWFCSPMRQKAAVGRNELLLFLVKTGSAAAGEGEEEDDAVVEARSCAVWV